MGRMEGGWWMMCDLVDGIVFFFLVRLVWGSDVVVFEYVWYIHQWNGRKKKNRKKIERNQKNEHKNNKIERNDNNN